MVMRNWTMFLFRGVWGRVWSILVKLVTRYAHS
jgi:hypothetical protein